MSRRGNFSRKFGNESINQNIDLSMQLETLVTESLMLGLSGDLMISTVLSLKLRHFLTRFEIFLVHVALNANTLALGNRDRSSPT